MNEEMDDNGHRKTHVLRCSGCLHRDSLMVIVGEALFEDYIEEQRA
jgi:hypothetical protein